MVYFIKVDFCPQSPACPGSGFTAGKIAISIRDMFVLRTCSSFVQDMQQAGVLDSSKDEPLNKRLAKAAHHVRTQSGSTITVG